MASTALCAESSEGDRGTRRSHPLLLATSGTGSKTDSEDAMCVGGPSCFCNLGLREAFSTGVILIGTVALELKRLLNSHHRHSDAGWHLPERV